MNNKIYRSARNKKQFINSYHVNEVPLPYYNPLADPYLSGYFANWKVQKHISRQGLVYSPKKQYPYESRRLKNAYKFHRDNSVHIPSQNINKSKIFNKSQFYGARKMDFYEDNTNDMSLIKRKSDSQMLKKRSEKIGDIGQLLSQRPKSDWRKRRTYFSPNKTHQTGKQQLYNKEDPFNPE